MRGNQPLNLVTSYNVLYQLELVCDLPYQILATVAFNATTDGHIHEQAMPTLETAKVLRSPDGQKRLTIVIHQHGMVSFTEYTWTVEDHPSLDEEITYWNPTHESGLYQSAEAAEQDARATLSWLKDARVDP